ncbi:MAG TPA: amidohydrolase family protein [Rectinemataceae bacterium]|nr:amidohydrolase family protein [Rectinemataceae bacterium]
MSEKTGAGEARPDGSKTRPGVVARAELPDFFDIHCHAHTLSHPSFLALIQTLRMRRLEALFSQLTSFEYLASSLFHRGGEKIRNMLSVMENEPGDIFKLMEDDLTGVYAKSADEKPLAQDGVLELGGHRYGKLVISPLLMDFNEPGPYKPDTYYDRYPNKTMDAQIVDVMLGIREYRLTRPNGLLEIQPFLGVTPKAYTAESLTRFLETWLSYYSRDRDEARADFECMGELLVGDVTRKHSPFAGIKLYPPLGFDPWPADGAEREKVEILYSFAEKRKIPLTTHCDDGGFRVLPLEESWRNSSPASYRPALERHPGLIINFAHLGTQYSIPNRLAPPPTAWRDEIFKLMVDFPGVYGDFSFNGVSPEYYDSLLATLGNMEPSTRAVAERRIMFGSDFMVNLIKVRSYADYFRIFSGSAIDPELKKAFCSDNPRRFLFGD